jgi:hypothetical protein
MYSESPMTSTDCIPGPICILGLVAGSFASDLRILILTQGVAYGFGFLIFYYPILSMVNEYWVARRGMAYGILCGASGLSGTVMPFVIQALQNDSSRSRRSSRTTYGTTDSTLERSSTIFSRTSRYSPMELDILSLSSLLDLLCLEYLARIRILLPIPVSAILCFISRTQHQKWRAPPCSDEHLPGRRSVCIRSII